MLGWIADIFGLYEPALAKGVAAGFLVFVAVLCTVGAAYIVSMLIVSALDERDVAERDRKAREKRADALRRRRHDKFMDRR